MATFNEDVSINEANLHINFGPTGSVNSGTPIGNGAGWIFIAPNGHRRDIVAWIGGLCIGASGDSGPSYGAGFNVMEDGRVGIGTDNPAATLHVVGDILATGPVHAGAGASLRGNVKGQAFTMEEGATVSVTVDADFDLPPELQGGRE